MGLGPPVCLDCMAIMVCYDPAKEGSHWWCEYCRKPLKQLHEEGKERCLFLMDPATTKELRLSRYVL